MTEYVVRFSVRQRIEHAAVMILFLALAVTGFPQKFHDVGWARALISMLGGLDTARTIHRLAGVDLVVVSDPGAQRQGADPKAGAAEAAVLHGGVSDREAVRERSAAALTPRAARAPRLRSRP